MLTAENKETLKASIGSVIDDNPQFAEMAQPKPNEAAIASLNEAVKTTPDEYSRVRSVAKQAELPTAVVQDNFKDADRIAKKKELGQLIDGNLSPSTIKHLENPDFAKVSADSVSHLSGLEWWLKAPIAAASDSVDDTRVSKLYFQKLINPKRQFTPDELDLIQRSENRQPTSYGAEGLPGEMLVSAAKFVPSMLSSAGGMIKGRVVGSVAGGVVGAATGAFTPLTPAGGAAVGANVGGNIGGWVGGFEDSYEQNAGQMYQEISKMTDPEGKPIDDNVARVASLVTAVPVAGLDMVSLENIAKTYPKWKSSLGKEAVKQALKNPAIYKAFVKMGAKYAGAIGSEAVTEATQEALQILGTNAATAYSNKVEGTDFKGISFDEGRKRVGETFVETAKGMALLGAPGPIASVRSDVREQVAAKKEQRIEQLSAMAKEDKVLKRAPDVSEAFVKSVGEDGGVKNAYIDAQKFVEHFQKQNIEPKQMAAALGVDGQLDEAVSLNGKLVVPAEKYYTTLAPTEHAVALKQDTSFAPDEMTARELREMNKEQEAGTRQSIDQVALKTEEMAKRDQELLKIQKDFESKALKAGRSKGEARALSMQFKAFFDTVTRRANVESPAEFYRQYPVKEILKRDSSALQIGEKAQAPFSGSRVNYKVYHGTPSQGFESFDKARIGSNFKGRGFFGSGFYFSNQEADARQYATGNGKVLEAYLDLKNPLNTMKMSTREWSDLLLLHDGLNGLEQGDTERKLLASVGEQTLKEAVKENGESLFGFLPDMSGTIREAGFDGVIAHSGLGDEMAEEIVAFEPHQIRPAGDKTTFYQGERGAIKFRDMDAIISLFKNADSSTLLHEMGHYFLDTFRRATLFDGVDPKLKEDFDATLRWLGAKDFESLTDEQIEKFAKGWEAYLMEGNAPSSQLAGVFRKFKRWLLNIYREVASLGVELNDEIRGVFGRLLTTDAEVENAAERREHLPLLKSSEEAGMTKEQFADYMRLNKTALESAEGEIIAKAMKKIGGERVKSYRELKGKIQEQVRAEADRMKVYIADKFIRTGKLDYVSEKGILVEAADVDKRATMTKLSRWMVEQYLADHKNLKIDDALLHKEGLHPDVLAELVGFDSGVNLMEWLGTYPDKETFIKQESAARLAQAFDAELLNADNIKMAAIESLQNDDRFGALAVELRALEKLAKRKAVSITAMKEYAKEKISKLPMKGLSEKKYLAAAMKSANLAMNAYAKKKYDDALQAKHQQLANLYLYKATVDAQEMIQKKTRFIKSLKDGGKHKTLVKVGNGYAEAVDGLLERFGFIKGTGTDYEPLAKWALERQTDGDPIVIADEILVQQQYVDYKELTVSHFDALAQAFDNIYTVARENLNFMQGMEGVTQDEVADKLVSSLQKNFKRKFEKQKSYTEASPEEDTVAEKLKRADGSLRIQEFVFDELDKYDDLGPASEYLYRTIARATGKYLNRSEKAARELGEIFKGFTPEELNKEEFVEGLGTMSKMRSLALLLNAGNAENYEAVVEGAKRFGFSEELYNKFLDSREKKDWDFAQKVWDYLETYWPEIREANRKRTGVDLERVEPREINTRFGAYKGGYFPLSYDKNIEPRVERREDVKSVNDLYGGRSNVPYTKHSHRKARVGSGGQAVNLDLGVLFTHTDEVVKDLEMYDAVRAVDRLINRKDVAGALSVVKGVNFPGDIRDWLNSGLNDGPVKLEVDKWVRKLRANASIVQMGWKISTAISQILGLTVTLDHLNEGGSNGVKWLGRGINWLYNGDRSARRAFINEQSPEIRNMIRTFDRDAKDAYRTLTEKNKQLSNIQKTFFTGMMLVQREVSMMTWASAWMKAKEELKYTDRQASEFADKAVRMTQGSGLNINMSQLLRSNNAWQRLFTMFQTFYSVLYNRFARLYGRARAGQVGPAQIITSMALLWWLPAAAGEFIVGRGPKDDEDFWKWLAKTELTYPLASIPVLGTIARGAVDKVFGDYVDGGYTPLEQVGKRTAKAAVDVAKIGERDVGENLTNLSKDALYLAGYYFGIPSGQADITVGAAIDALNGEETSPQDFIFRKARR